MNSNETQAATAAETPAGAQISVAQLAQGLALKRRQRNNAASPAPETPEPTTQAPGPESPEPGNQSSPAEEADPNVLWNTQPPPPEPGTETEAEPGEAAEIETAETEPEPGEAPEGQPGPGEEPRGVRKLQKRVDKLTATLRATQEALTKANELLGQRSEEEPAAAAEPTRAEPTPASSEPFAGHPEVAKLSQELGTLNGLLRWARENEGGGEYSDGKVAEYFDADQIRNIRDRAELRRTEILAEKGAVLHDLRRQDQDARRQYDTVYSQAYGDLERGITPEAQEFQRIAAQAPWIRQFPNWKLVIGDTIRGRKAREAAMAKARPAGRGARGGEPAPVSGRPMAAAGAVSPERKQVRVAAEAYARTGSMDDLAKAIAAKRAADRAR